MKGTVGIMGYGAFGAFLLILVRRFAPEVAVRVYSSRQEPDGETFFSLDDTCSSDILFLAVPIHTFRETLEKILPMLGEKTVVVDVSTVKSYTSALLKEILGTRPYIATHPMFGPESYSKRNNSVVGFRVVVTEHTLSEEIVTSLGSFLTSCGFVVIRMTSEEHDRQLAGTLFLTHYVGQIIHRADFERTDIDTVSFGYLMDAVESVRNDTALFEDVFRFNPYCAETIHRFEDAEKAIRDTLPSHEA